MKNFNGLTLSLVQMRVIPGRPDLNADSIIAEIKSAGRRGVDIIVFPEMSTTGYLIGDILEDDYFVNDVMLFNNDIVEATTSMGITAVFGTVISSSQKGEDGRQRLYNAAVVASDGKIVAWTHKTLQPNYRFFNDSKHLYSRRAAAEERSELLRLKGSRITPDVGLRDYLKPIRIETKKACFNLGVILCEDMWHEDYAFNPTNIVVEQGAELIINLSASPWTWRKNEKRHRVVKELLSACRVPLVYVNNTGAQNTGKNILVFDGSSAVYDDNGDVMYEVASYEARSARHKHSAHFVRPESRGN